MEHDDYGFCYDIEKDLAKVLHRDGYLLLAAHFLNRIESAMPAGAGVPRQAMFEYGNEIHLPALSLKSLFEARGDSKSYAKLCERLGLSPRDAERLARMEIKKGRWERSLTWIEKGLALEPLRDWRNESSSSLTDLKPKILAKLDRKEAALEMAWADFEKDPCDMAYENLMQYVPRCETAQCHLRAMQAAGEKADLSQFIDLCVQTKEWERLAGRIQAATNEELEAVSHYASEPAAAALSKREASTAAKLYRALGMRILRQGKSKYYGSALQHFRHAHRMYLKAGRLSEWQALVSQVHSEHSRKSGFLNEFEALS